MTLAYLTNYDVTPTSTSLNAGTVTFTLSFSDTVSLDPLQDAPALVLNGGAVANYTAGDGSRDLVFSYTIGQGDTSSDLTLVSIENPDSIVGAVLSDPGGLLAFDPQIVVDTTAPTVAITSPGQLTNQAAQIISGTVGSEDAGTVVHVMDGSQDLGQATVDAGGNWSVGVTLDGDGPHVLLATDTDAAGNTGVSGVVFNLDTTAPTVAIASPGQLTSRAVQTISGTVGIEDAGTVVHVMEGSQDLGRATVDAGGNWSVGVTLDGDGPHMLLATDTDAAGNSGISTGVVFNLDTTPPTVAITSPGQLTNQAAQIITGTVGSEDAGTVVHVMDGSQDLGQATVDGDGNWSVGITLDGDGPHMLLATDTDAAGNSGISTGAAFMLDTAAPTVAITSPGQLTNQAAQIISGTVGIEDAGTVVHVMDGSQDLGQATVDGDGNWSVGVTLEGDGPHVVLATDTDAAGNTGSSTGAAFMLDTAAPTVAITSPGQLTNQAAQIISGTVGSEDAGTVVHVMDGSQDLGQATVDGDGNWSVGVTLDGDGPHVLLATDTDAAGNSGISTGAAFMLDTTAPTVAITSPGQLTNQAAKIISGTVGSEDAGTVVHVMDGSQDLGQATVDGDGNWSVGITLDGDGPHMLLATDTDAAGNSGISTGAAFMLDTAAPTVAITSPGQLTNQAAQIISGTVGIEDAGTVVHVMDGSQDLGQATVDGDGNWSVGVTLEGDGPHVVLATDTDAAGNTGSSTGAAFMLDTAAPTVAITSPGQLTNQAAQIISGTVGIEDAGTVVHMMDGSQDLGQATVDGDGNWSVGVTLDGDGPHMLLATDTDAAGNTGVSGVVFDLDTAAPTVEFSVPEMIEASSASGAVVQFTPSFDNPADNSAVISYTEGDHDVTSGGTFSLGHHVILATATDTAGNIGMTSFSFDVVDTTRPVVNASAPSVTEATSRNGAVVRFTASATDTVDGHDPVTFTENDQPVASGDIFAVGHHDLVASAADANGNTDTQSFGFDVVNPIPVITSAGLVTKTASQAVSGTGEIGSSIQLYDGDNAVGAPVTVGQDGHWSVGVTLTEGRHSFTAVNADGSGYASTASAPVTDTLYTDIDPVTHAALPVIDPDLSGAISVTIVDIGLSGGNTGNTYEGPVSYLQNQFVWSGTQGIAAASNAPNTFMHGGTGDDALQVSSGSNVLDGGDGSNFLVGALGGDGGHDVFFVDARSSSPTWTTIVNFHAGDQLTIWGFGDSTGNTGWMGQAGADGSVGATLLAHVNGHDSAVTFAGLSNADGQALTFSTGSVDGQNYLLITRGS